MNYQILKKVVENKGYVFFDEGDYDLNFIWVRTSDVFTNMFTDLLHIAYKKNGIEQVVTLNATTKASLYGNGGATNPVPGGTAVIVPGQYRSAWSYTEGNGTGTLPWGKPYFQQIKGISYWRDVNKNNIIDKTNIQYNQIFGTNWHIMMEPLSVNVPGSLPWSEGCKGISQSDMLDIVAPITREAVKIWGPNFTGTLLESKDFPQAEPIHATAAPIISNLS